METTNLLRVEGGGGNFGHAGQSFGGHQDAKRQKMHALFDALEGSNLPLAKQIFRVLLNLEPMLRQDALFTKIGQAIDSGNLYAAQHFMRDMKAKVVNAQSFKSFSPSPAPNARAAQTPARDGQRINLRA